MTLSLGEELGQSQHVTSGNSETEYVWKLCFQKTCCQIVLQMKNEICTGCKTQLRIGGMDAPKIKDWTCIPVLAVISRGIETTVTAALLPHCLLRFQNVPEFSCTCFYTQGWKKLFIKFLKATEKWPGDHYFSHRPRHFYVSPLYSPHCLSMKHLPSSYF